MVGTLLPAVHLVGTYLNDGCMDDYASARQLAFRLTLQVIAFFSLVLQCPQLDNALVSLSLSSRLFLRFCGPAHKPQQGDETLAVLGSRSPFPNGCNLNG